tara:strand:- start:2577 stop:2840 length:264 start_codon:yes stop_codon:yes gene_type:complete
MLDELSLNLLTPGGATTSSPHHLIKDDMHKFLEAMQIYQGFLAIVFGSLEQNAFYRSNSRNDKYGDLISGKQRSYNISLWSRHPPVC